MQQRLVRCKSHSRDAGIPRINGTRDFNGQTSSPFFAVGRFNLSAVGTHDGLNKGKP
jgi:hypothetical protein